MLACCLPVLVMISCFIYKHLMCNSNGLYRVCIIINYPSWQMVLQILWKHVTEGEVCGTQCECLSSRQGLRRWSYWANNKTLHSFCQECRRGRIYCMCHMQVEFFVRRRAHMWPNILVCQFDPVCHFFSFYRAYDFSKSGFGPRTVILCDQVFPRHSL